MVKSDLELPGYKFFKTEVKMDTILSNLFRIL